MRPTIGCEWRPSSVRSRHCFCRSVPRQPTALIVSQACYRRRQRRGKKERTNGQWDFSSRGSRRDGYESPGPKRINGGLLCERRGLRIPADPGFTKAKRDSFGTSPKRCGLTSASSSRLTPTSQFAGALYSTSSSGPYGHYYRWARRSSSAPLHSQPMQETPPPEAPDGSPILHTAGRAPPSGALRSARARPTRPVC